MPRRKTCRLRRDSRQQRGKDLYALAARIPIKVELITSGVEFDAEAIPTIIDVRFNCQRALHRVRYRITPSADSSNPTAFGTQRPKHAALVTTTKITSYCGTCRIQDKIQKHYSLKSNSNGGTYEERSTRKGLCQLFGPTSPQCKAISLGFRFPLFTFNVNLSQTADSALTSWPSLRSERHCQSEQA